MGWPKGRPRGTSSLKGRKVLDLDARYIQEILDDLESTPEVRFCAVMDLLLEAMRDSTNSTVEQVGISLNRFWRNDMERTVIWTPGESDEPTT